MARPRKPTETKRRAGTLQKCRVLADEMQTPPGEPTMPAGLDEIAAGCWRRLAPELLKLGVLSPLHFGDLEGLCVAYSTAVRFQKLADKGLIIETPFGPKVNPAVKQARDSWREMRAFATEFGLSPVAQSRVSASGKPKEDTAEAFLFGGAPLRVVK